MTKDDKDDQTVHFLGESRLVKDGRIRFCGCVVIVVMLPHRRSQESLDMLAVVDAALSPGRCSPFHIDPLPQWHQKMWCNETAN